jgi:uncharacterized protein YkvS
MSGGKRYKFQGSLIKVMTGFDGGTNAITAISKAAEAVVTSAAHGLASGDVVYIDGVVGMVEVNDAAYIVEVVTADTFRLVDTDSTGWTTYASGGNFEQAEFSNFCELTGYNRQGGSSSEAPATSLCSVAQEFELGLPDSGTTQFDFNFAPRTAIQAALKAYDASKELMATHITLPKNGGVMVQLGFVQQMSEQSAVDGLWTASATMRNSGARYDVAAA